MKGKIRIWEKFLRSARTGLAAAVFLLALAVFFGLPGHACAADAFDLWIQGERVTPENCEDVLGDQTVSYDPAQKRLKLSGAVLQAADVPGTSDAAAIWAADDLTVALEGNNSITADPAAVTAGYLNGICFNGEVLTLEGSGTLTITGSAADSTEFYGLYAGWDSLVTLRGTTLTIHGETADWTHLYGLDCLGAVVIDGACLTVQAAVTGSHASEILACSAEETVQIKNGSEVVCDVENAASEAFCGSAVVSDTSRLTVRNTGRVGTAFYGDLTVSGNAQVSLSGGAFGMEESRLTVGAGTVVELSGGISALDYSEVVLDPEIPAPQAAVSLTMSPEDGEAWDQVTPLSAEEDHPDVAFHYIRIPSVPLEGASVTGLSAGTYTGKALKPAPVVKLSGKTLKAGKEYTVSYQNNTKAGTATVTITGKGIHTGTIRKTFRIDPAPIGKAAVSGLSAKTYTGKALTPAPVLTFGGKTLKKGTDYAVSYKNNTKAGTASVTIRGLGNFTGTASKTFAIRPASIAKAKISGLSDAMYTGKAVTRTPVVKLGTKTLKAGTEYTVSYQNNIRVGTAAVKVTGKGNYTGTVSGSFKIKDSVTEFVSRLYRVCLDREPEPQGLAWWVQRLKSRAETGGSCAWGFFDSTEFKNHRYGNAAFLDHAYRAFFDRKPDAAGKAWWLAEMKKGRTRRQVIEGFAESKEFAALCKTYHIDP